MASQWHTPMATSLSARHGSFCSKTHLMVPCGAPGELVHIHLGKAGYGLHSSKQVNASEIVKAAVAESPTGTVVLRSDRASKFLNRPRETALTGSSASSATTSSSQDEEASADEALAEARAAERALNAANYSPLRLAQEYGRQPFKVCQPSA